MLSFPIKISFGPFLVCWLIYIVASYYLFIVTSGGWSGFFFHYMVGALFYIVCGAVIFIRTAFYQSHKINYVSVGRKLLIFLLVSQVLALLFNSGDCGDAEGSFVYYQTFFTNAQNICGSSISELDSLLSIVSLFLYIIALGIFMIEIFPRNKSKYD